MRAAAAVSSANEACTRHKTPAFFSLPSFPELQCHVDFLSPIKQSISLSNNAVQGSPLSAARRRQVGACRVSPLVGRRREGELVSAVGIEPLKKGKNSAGKKKKKKKKRSLVPSSPSKIPNKSCRQTRTCSRRQKSPGCVSLLLLFHRRRLLLLFSLLPGRRRRRAPDPAPGPLGPSREIPAAPETLPRPAPQRRHEQEGVRGPGAAQGDRRDDDRRGAAGDRFFFSFVFFSAPYLSTSTK